MSDHHSSKWKARAIRLPDLPLSIHAGPDGNYYVCTADSAIYVIRAGTDRVERFAGWIPEEEISSSNELSFESDQRAFLFSSFSSPNMTQASFTGFAPIFSPLGPTSPLPSSVPVLEPEDHAEFSCIVQSTLESHTGFAKAQPPSFGLKETRKGEPTGIHGHRLTNSKFRFIDSPWMSWREDGTILVADDGFNLIRIISGDELTLFAGSTHGSLDGPRYYCQFSHPTFVKDHYHSGNIFVIDDPHVGRLRKIDADGMVSTIWRCHHLRRLDCGPDPHSFVIAHSKALSLLDLRELEDQKTEPRLKPLLQNVDWATPVTMPCGLLLFAGTRPIYRENQGRKLVDNCADHAKAKAKGRIARNLARAQRSSSNASSSSETEVTNEEDQDYFASPAPIGYQVLPLSLLDTRIVLENAEIPSASVDPKASHCPPLPLPKLDLEGSPINPLATVLCVNFKRGELAYINPKPPSRDPSQYLAYIVSGFCPSETPAVGTAEEAHYDACSLEDLLSTPIGQSISDLSLSHHPTSTTFRVHKSVLQIALRRSKRRWKSEKEFGEALVSLKEIPLEIIQRVLHELYGCHSTHRQSPMNYALDCAHLSLCFARLGLEKEKIREERRLQLVLAQLTLSELCTLSSRIFSLENSSHLLEMLASFLRPEVDEFVATWAEQEQLEQDAMKSSGKTGVAYELQPLKQLLHLMQPGGAATNGHPSTSALPFSRRLYEPSWEIPVHSCPVKRALQEIGARLSWICGVSPLPPPIHHFRFIIQDQMIDVQSWILLPQWKYFRRMMEAGMAETKQNRTCHLPSDLPPSLFLVMLRFLHGVCIKPTDLSESDCHFFLTRGGEFDCWSGIDKIAVPRFKLLMDMCWKKLVLDISATNCIRLLAYRLEIGAQQAVEKAIDFVAVHFDEAIRAPGALHFLQNLPESIVSKVVPQPNTPATSTVHCK